MYYKIFHISTSFYLKENISKVDNSRIGPLNPLNDWPLAVEFNSEILWYREYLEDMKFYSKNEAENILHKKLYFDIFWQNLCLNEFELHEFTENGKYIQSYEL